MSVAIKRTSLILAALALAIAGLFTSDSLRTAHGADSVSLNIGSADAVTNGGGGRNSS